MNDDTLVLQTKGLLKRYGATAVVDQVDLEVPRGAIYGFLGPNGAGKTTTIRMLLGLLAPDAGSVRVFGLPLATERARVLGRLGALVETPSLYPHLTGRENLEVTRRLLAVEKAALARALESAGLTEAADRPVSGYSLGMKQRLGLALALLASPELLVLDEPANGLDPAGIQTMRATLKRLANEEGVTVFLSSHLLSEVEQLATHVGILGSGRLVFQGTRAGLAARITPHLLLRAEPLEAVAALLRKAGYAVERLAGEGVRALSVAVDSEDAAAAVAAAVSAHVVRAGHALHHLSLERQSLEETFLELTAGRTLEDVRCAA